MLEKFFKKIFNKEVFLYIFFGILTTLVDAVVFYIFNNIFKTNYIFSTILAWCFAVLFAYITNKLWVFNSIKVKNILKEIISFFSLRLVSLGLSVIFMVISVEIFKIDEFISKLIANIFVVISNYFFSKLFIFKKGENDV